MNNETGLVPNPRIDYEFDPGPEGVFSDRPRPRAFKVTEAMHPGDFDPNDEFVPSGMIGTLVMNDGREIECEVYLPRWMVPNFEITSEPVGPPGFHRGMHTVRYTIEFTQYSGRPR